MNAGKAPPGTSNYRTRTSHVTCVTHQIKSASQSMASLQTSTDGSVRGQGIPLPRKGVGMGMREEQADCSKRGRSVQDTKGHPHKGIHRFVPSHGGQTKIEPQRSRVARPGQISSRNSTGSISWSTFILPQTIYLQPTLKPPLVWSYPEPQDP